MLHTWKYFCLHKFLDTQMQIRKKMSMFQVRTVRVPVPGVEERLQRRKGAYQG